jgi:hypothetical protein
LSIPSEVEVAYKLKEKQHKGGKLEIEITWEEAGRHEKRGSSRGEGFQEARSSQQQPAAAGQKQGAQAQQQHAAQQQPASR